MSPQSHTRYTSDTHVSRPPRYDFLPRRVRPFHDLHNHRLRHPQQSRPERADS